ncbi:MAG: DUF4157 domain-containing protein [Candidatus Electrothrix scaldis]|nr:MAG: DUF4157 domain-containing protein [Candidatus Electrothrix sp. GW3-3]
MCEYKEKDQQSGMVTGLTGVAQRKKRGRAKGFAFEDNRPETAQLRGLFPQRPGNEAGRPVLQAKDFNETKQLKPREPVQKKENKTGLPDDLKAGVENLSGLAMDDVRVSYNSDKPAQLNAHAYTQGTEIHVAPGQEKHLPHEAWHVVQQKEGRVQPTVQMKAGMAVNDDAGLEREADVMGMKALQMRPSEKNVTNHSPSSKPVVQALMDVGAFQALTPSAFLRKRKDVKLIDVALGNYNGSDPANKLNMLNTLIGVLNNYIGGDHDAGRIATATALRGAANAELALLNALGAPNYGLIDDLMFRSGGAANIVNLTTVVTTATPAHVAHLPALVTMSGGAAGLINLNALIVAVGIGNIPYLSGALTAVGGFANRAHITNILAETGLAGLPSTPNFLTLAGGIGNIAGLITVLHYNPNQPDRASQFLAAANGNLGRFALMHTWLGEFNNNVGAVQPNGTVLGMPVVGGGGRFTGAGLHLTARMKHFGERHVADTFAFTRQNINYNHGQSFWPAGTTTANMRAALEHTLQLLVPFAGYPPVGPPHTGIATGVGGGVTAQIYIRNTAGTNYDIGQFYPDGGAIPTFTGLEMDGIGQVLGHI